MGFKQKASSGKKKGPKGKKARAKAKIDRQWGETRIENEEAQSRRIGNSRLLGKKSTERKTAVIPSKTDKSKSTVKFSKSRESDPKMNHRRPRYSKNGATSDDSSDEDSENEFAAVNELLTSCLLYTSPSQRD